MTMNRISYNCKRCHGSDCRLRTRINRERADMKIRRSRLALRSPLTLRAAFGFIAVLASPAAAQTVVKGPPILDQAIGKLAVAEHGASIRKASSTSR